MNLHKVYILGRSKHNPVVWALRLYAKLAGILALLATSLSLLGNASAQSSTIDGSLYINSDESFATYYKVSVSISCSSDLGFRCLSITVSFPNQDANLSPDEADVVDDIKVTSSSGSLVVSALETGLDTGIFTFELQNFAPTGLTLDDHVYPLPFEDGEIIEISGLPLSKDDGEKNVSAVIYNSAEDFAELQDDIILDTAPPPSARLFLPTDGLPSNVSKPTFDWSDVKDANGIGSYFIEIDNNPRFSSSDIYGTAGSSFDNPAALKDGTYFWRVWATDFAGNTGPKSEPFSFVIDTLPPDSPIITSPIPGAQVNNPFHPITGLAEPNASLNVFVDGVRTTINVPNTGEWEIIPDFLDAGRHIVSAIAVDAAGNTSGPTTVAFSLVTSAPVGSIVINSGDKYATSREVVLTTTCVSAPGSECIDMRISTEDILEANFEKLAATKTVLLSAGDGVKQVYLQVRDSAGNLSEISVDEIILDATAPLPPNIVEPEANSSSAENSVEIRGTSEPGSRVQLFDGSVPIWQINSDESGSWATRMDLELGRHTISATATDIVGNTSASSNIITITIESVIVPAISIDSTSNTNPRPGIDSVTVYGKSSDAPGSVIVVDWDDGSDPTEVPVSRGTWSASHVYANGQDGTKNIIARLIINGQPEATSNTYSVSLQKPDNPTGIIVAAVAGAGAGLAGLKLYKSKLKKRPPTSVKLIFNYGIEDNDKEITADEIKPDPASDPKIQEGFMATLGQSIAPVKEALGQAKQITDIVNFCREAKEEPDNFLARIADTAFEEMLKIVMPVLSRYFIEDISVETEFRILNSSNKTALFDIDVKMRPIRPFIEAALLVNGVKTEAAKFLFEINTLAQINKLELGASSEVVTRDIEDIRVELDVFLSSISITHVGKPVAGKHLLNKPIRLAKREFHLKSVALAPVPPDTSEIKPDSDIVEKICPSCKKTVKTAKFCPECGFRILD